MNSNNAEYWDKRSRMAVEYKGEKFYTVTPLPYYYRRRAILLNHLDSFFWSNDIEKVCDFGCGDGWYLQYFSTKFGKKKYFGVDSSEKMIERAGYLCPTADLHVSSNVSISTNPLT